MKPFRSKIHVIRPGTSPELLLRVFRLRYRIYVDEMGLAVGGDPVGGLRDEADAHSVNLLCEVDGQDVGTLRFVGAREHALELYEQSESWSRTIREAGGDRDAFEVNRFMVVREARRTDVAMRLVRAAFDHATASGYRNGYIAAKAGRLLAYYRTFYRGRQLTRQTTPYRVGAQVLGHYHLMRFDLGARWSLRRLGLGVYYRALGICARHLRPVLELFVGRRSGYSADVIPREISQAPSSPFIGG